MREAALRRDRRKRGIRVLKHPATGLEARLSDERVRRHPHCPREFPEKLQGRLIRRYCEISQCQRPSVLIRNTVQHVPDSSQGWKLWDRWGVRTQSDEMKCQLLQRKRIRVRGEQCLPDAPT